MEGVLSLETTSPGVWDGGAGWGMPGGWKEWIDEESGPWFALQVSDIRVALLHFWAAALGTLMRISQRTIVWHA